MSFYGFFDDASNGQNLTVPGSAVAYGYLASIGNAALVRNRTGYGKEPYGVGEHILWASEYNDTINVTPAQTLYSPSYIKVLGFGGSAKNRILFASPRYRGFCLPLVVCFRKNKDSWISVT